MFESDLGLFKEFDEKPGAKNKSEKHTEDKAGRWFPAFEIIITPEVEKYQKVG